MKKSTFSLVSIALVLNFLGCAHRVQTQEKKVAANKVATKSPAGTAQKSVSTKTAKPLAVGPAVSRRTANEVQTENLPAPQNKTSSRVVVTEKQKELFLVIQEHFTMKRFAEFSTQAELFVKSFSESPLNEDVRYLQGLVALEQKQFGPALKFFSQAEQSSIETVQRKALYAKGITYQKMNLEEPAKNILKQVQTLFPGTLEAENARAELLVIEKVIR